MRCDAQWGLALVKIERIAGALGALIGSMSADDEALLRLVCPNHQTLFIV